MDGPIQDGIRDGGIWKTGVPIRHRYLGSNDRGGLSKAVIEHFQQILSGRDWDGVTHPIIQDQHIRLVERMQQGQVRAILPGLIDGMQKTEVRR